MDMRHVCCIALLLWSRNNVAYPDPFYVWPLVPSHPEAEIASLSHSSTGITGCLSRTSGHPALDYNSVTLAGSAASYLEFTINPSVLIKDFSFMFFISPVGTSGTLLQFEKQSMNSGSGEIKMFTLSYNESTLYTDVKGDNSTDDLLNISLVTHLSSTNWTPITVSYDQGSEEFSIFAGNVTIKVKHDRVNPFLGLPGKVRLGGTFGRDDSSYHGRITCLHFYDHKTSDNDFEDALLRCLSNLWPPSLTAMPGSLLPSCDIKKGFYKLKSRGEPHLSIIPILNMSNTTKIKCANTCLLPTNDCVSFSINILESTCSLYDVDASSNLNGDKNARYYISNSLIG